MTVVCMVTPNCRKKKKGCDNCLSSQLLKISYSCRVHYTALGLLLWVPAATKRLASGVTPIISRSDVSKYYTGSAPWGVLDVELGFGTVIQVPESTVDTVTQFIVDSWWAVFFFCSQIALFQKIYAIYCPWIHMRYISIWTTTVCAFDRVQKITWPHTRGWKALCCDNVLRVTLQLPRLPVRITIFVLDHTVTHLQPLKHTNTHTLLPLLTANILSVGRKSLKWQSVLLNYQALQKETPGPRCRRDNS